MSTQYGGAPRLLGLALAMLVSVATLAPVTGVAAQASLQAGQLQAGQGATVANTGGEGALLRDEPSYDATFSVILPDGTAVQLTDGPIVGADGTQWFAASAWGETGFLPSWSLAPVGGEEATPAVTSTAPTEGETPAAATETTDADVADDVVTPAVPTPAAAVVTPGPNTATIDNTNGDSIRCRVAADYDAPVVAELVAGDVVELAGEILAGWQPVTCDDQFGYVYADYLAYADPNLEAAAVLAVEEAAAAELAADEEPTVTETAVVPAETATEIADGSTAQDGGSSASAGSGTRARGTSTVAATPAPATEAPATEAPATDEPTATGTDAVTATEATATATEATATEATATDVAAPTEEAAFSAADFSAAAIGGPVGTITGTNGDGANCRAAASYSGRVLTVLREGLQVTLRGGVQGEWQPVVCAGQNGFVFAAFVTGGGGAQPTATATRAPGGTTTGAATVTGTNGSGVRCRSAASYTASVITVLAEGTRVALRGGVQGEWQPVVCAGTNGFVFASFLGTGGTTPQPTATATRAPATQAPTSPSGGAATVTGTNGDGVRCRSAASYSGSVIVVLAEGSRVALRGGVQGEWQPVVCASQNGFVYAGFLSSGGGTAPPPTATRAPATAAPTQAPVTGLAIPSNAKVTSALNLRYSASFSAGVAAVVPAGTVVRITGGPSSGFYRADWDGLGGYLYGDYLAATSAPLSERGGSGSGPGQVAPTPPPSTGSGSGIVNFAMRYQGYPYVWATAGPASFDCSGFTYWVVKNVVGRDIGRGLQTQVVAGTPVSRSNLQPGDLVFFQNTYTWGLSHSGIYIGNNQFIHAENENTGVKISDLNSTYYSTRWYGAVRM